jgi:glycosyltransferase involved in cell wall biosynthesis
MSQDRASNDSPLRGRRILIIVENLPLPFDRRVWQEALALRNAGASVWTISPAAKGYEARYECLEGIHVHRHPAPPEGRGLLGYGLEYGAALVWEFILTCKVFFSAGLDAIQACNPPDLIFLVALPFKLFGCRFVFDHHDINPELFEAKFGRRGVLWRLITFLERLTFAAADVSLATNESYRRIAIERGRMRPEDVFVVRSGPDLSRLRATAPAARWREGRAFLVGYVGVMGQQEGIDLLLEVVATLVARGRRDIQFCLVGGGPSLPELRRRCTDLGLDPYVTFTGRAPDADLIEILSTADICVKPDRVNAMNSLSTMNKILEYMAFGKPIVQFEVVEGRVSAGDASLYARPNVVGDFADKLEYLLASPETRARMGAVGLARIEGELSWPHQIPHLLEAYDRLFAR